MSNLQQLIQSSTLFRNWQALIFFIGITTVIYFLFRKKKNNIKIEPKKWVQVGRVKQLAIYPLKSCQGIEVSKALATQIGFRSTTTQNLRDRVFMIMDRNSIHGDTIKIPKMASISIEIQENAIVLSTPFTPAITVPIPEDTPEARRNCKFAAEKIAELLDCGDDVADWLDEFLGTSGYRLYYHHQETTQRIGQSPLQKRFQIPPTAKGTLQNDTAYQLINHDSLDALNLELEKPVLYDSFRPNILVEGTPAAFCEDLWDIIRIGDEADGVCFKSWLPSSRCGQINIDQKVGIISEDREPLKTLYKIQRRNPSNPVADKYCRGKPIMGIHLGILTQGEAYSDRILRVGDPVFALV